MKKIGIAAILMTLSIVAGCNFIHNRGTIEAYSQPPVEVSEENSVSDTDGNPEGSEQTRVKTYPADAGAGFPAEGVYFDVTGDGNDDKCNCRMTGSGMVRVQCIVEDEVNSARYVLDGYNYSYSIKGVEDGRLVVTETGPYGYNDLQVETYGTVKIKNDRLVFVADADTLKKGLIVREKKRNDQGKGDEDYDTVTILRKGEKVYEGYGSVVEIRSADNMEVVLEIEGCLVEPNPDGTINLNKEPLKEITIKRNQTIVLKSQTMDGGVTLEIKYE